MKSQVSTYVEVKRVTWSKDSHGLFDYESKNVNFTKDKVENSARVYKEVNDIKIRPIKDSETEMEVENPDYLFSIIKDSENPDRFSLSTPDIQSYDSNLQNLFLIVRSLKNEEGTQRGYTLELGDILRLGRIEYKVVEYQDHTHTRHSLFDLTEANQTELGNLIVKKCETDPTGKPQCRICLMDEHDTDDILVNPCNCKGTSEYVHINCLQVWINSKVKNKSTNDSSCWYWKHLICEVCKSPFPDMVDISGRKIQLVPTCKPDSPYMLLERIFYDRTKGGDNSKMLILLSVTNEAHQIKLGRGHDCDLRENDISVSRLHAFIRYENSKFVIVDNNSKFGTLILLRKGFDIDKRKIAVQLGRTVITFSLKQSVNNAPPKLTNPMVLEKKQQQLQLQKNPDDFNGKELNDFDMNDNNLE